MSENDPQSGAAEGHEHQTPGWEAWSRVAIFLGFAMAILWALVFARLGMTSVRIHAMAIPTAGALTLAVLAWGLVVTMLRPPIMRRSRTIAFVVLLATGYVGNVPMLAVPLASDGHVSAEKWELPVHGDWLTLAGGAAVATNFHATTASTRWAYDFTRVVDGKKFRLDGKKSADWYCFGQPVYAPVSGKVVLAVSGLVDNVPGQISPDSLLGNMVAIEAAPGEVAFIAHLQKGSVKLHAGDTVTAGTEIGRCGNSGRSPEPHVHMHVQDRVDFPIAMGIPIEFSNYIADGKPVSKGMPRGSTDWDALDGQVVSPR